MFGHPRRHAPPKQLTRAHPFRKVAHVAAGNHVPAPHIARQAARFAGISAGFSASVYAVFAVGHGLLRYAAELGSASLKSRMSYGGGTAIPNHK
jgi:hypothetical protein